MLLRYYFSCLALLAATSLGAQDSTWNRLKEKIDFNIGAGWTKQSNTDFYGNTPSVVVPPLLPRRANDQLTRQSWGLNGDEATNNPLWHGCVYVELAGRVRITDSISIRASIVAENRSFSYGLYTPAYALIYPKFTVKGAKTLNLLKQKIEVGGAGGYRDSFRLFEGLSVYNIDVDNFSVYAQWKKFRIYYSDIGDMIFNSGLNVDGAFTWIASFEKLQLSQRWNTDIRLGTTRYAMYIYPNDITTYDLSAAFYNDYFRIYGQYSYRNSNPSLRNMGAALAGIKYLRREKNWSLTATFEGRYYGGGYNTGFIQEGIYYRPASGQGFIGSSAYPLMLYNRPFSKWAVFTEYRRKNIVGASLYADFKLKLIGHINLKAEMDLNALKPEDADWVYLPFYTAGLSYEPVSGTWFFAGISNKGMNLDKHYPDFYSYRSPVMQFQLIRTVGW